ncbi:MAG: hypothetical protein JXA94_04695, partial [Parachlamydiales bacterium]|nr:hypothetical protein [Parachlamydiales bacterium]
MYCRGIQTLCKMAKNNDIDLRQTYTFISKKASRKCSQYIVGARLANAPKPFIDSITSRLKKQDGSVIRLYYPNRSYDVVCTYSEKRAKK